MNSERNTQKQRLNRNIKTITSHDTNDFYDNNKILIIVIHFIIGAF